MELNGCKPTLHHRVLFAVAGGSWRHRVSFGFALKDALLANANGFRKDVKMGWATVSAKGLGA